MSKDPIYHLSQVKITLDMCFKLIRTYDWLLDLYVVDFFVENHWQLLPLSWKDCLEEMGPQDIGDLLSGTPSKKQLLPLSLLAFIKSIKVLSIPRNPVKFCNGKELVNEHPKLRNLLLKHVKLKKRHEISLMANVVSKTATDTGCRSVIDFGSGLGHLMRVLAYRNSLQTAGIECQEELTNEARKLDMEYCYIVKKYISQEEFNKLCSPLHFNLTLTCHQQLLDLDLPESMAHYGLIGLHPCGNLGPLLLKHFTKHDNVKFICVVGCCYMKLTDSGYPMSNFVNKLDSKLSYPAREISCHAIEVYCDRLKKGHYEDLKIHAYRAAFERVLRAHDPKLRHSPVRSIKHTDSMTFERYCSLALERIAAPISVTGETLCHGLSDVAQWRRVVALFSLRLALAPVVETVVLLDRVLYVLEHGLWCEIHPVFDPNLSARNHIIIAKR